MIFTFSYEISSVAFLRVFLEQSILKYHIIQVDSYHLFQFEIDRIVLVLLSFVSFAGEYSSFRFLTDERNACFIARQ